MPPVSYTHLDVYKRQLKDSMRHIEKERPSSEEGYLLVPVKEEENMLGELEQTYHLEKIFRMNIYICYLQTNRLRCV